MEQMRTSLYLVWTDDNDVRFRLSGVELSAEAYPFKPTEQLCGSLTEWLLVRSAVYFDHKL